MLDTILQWASEFTGLQLGQSSDDSSTEASAASDTGDAGSSASTAPDDDLDGGVALPGGAGPASSAGPDTPDPTTASSDPTTPDSPSPAASSSDTPGSDYQKGLEAGEAGGPEQCIVTDDPNGQAYYEQGYGDGIQESAPTNQDTDPVMDYKGRVGTPDALNNANLADQFAALNGASTTAGQLAAGYASRNGGNAQDMANAAALGDATQGFAGSGASTSQKILDNDSTHEPASPGPAIEPNQTQQEPPPP